MNVCVLKKYRLEVGLHLTSLKRIFEGYLFPKGIKFIRSFLGKQPQADVLGMYSELQESSCQD